MVLDGGVVDTGRSAPIAARPQAIWDVLADFGSLGSWAQCRSLVSVVRGPDGGPVGTTRRVQVGRDTLVERIAEFDPPAAGLRHRGPALPGCAGRQSLDTGGQAGIEPSYRDQHGRNQGTPGGKGGRTVVGRVMADSPKPCSPGSHAIGEPRV